MSPCVSLTRVNQIPVDSRVCHYDELDESAKERFPELSDDRSASIDAKTARSFEACDLIKYTDYYEIDLE